MEPNVELINNPYQQRLKVLINGQAVSVYSNVEKYLDEPFSYWCDRILKDIYEECNQGSFRLHFCSRQEEMAVMEKIAEKDPNCSQYTSSPLIRSTPMLERIKGLHQLIRKNQITGFKSVRKSALFLIPDSCRAWKPDLEGLEVKNVFCEIESRVMFYQDYQKRPVQADIVFLISDGRSIEDYSNRLGIQKGFGLLIGERRRFLEKYGDLFLYETLEKEIFDTIFECLLLSPLADAFCGCIRSLSIDIKDKYRDELEELQSIAYKVIPKPEKTTIEVGHSSRIQFAADLPGYEIKGSQLHYSYSAKGIIRCNGLLVEGLKEGKATLQIYQEGEQLPCASVEYTVIRRNRITQLNLDESSIHLGEGDQCRIQYNYLPPDADNVESVEWGSDDESIARVDQYGNVTGIRKGKCTIRCFAEQVSASCECVVKPHLKSITVEFHELIMIYGEERYLYVTLSPEDCIDDSLVVSSMDMQTVNVVGRTIKAVGVGTTRVVIQNKEETVREEIQIQVMTEAEFKKWQKEKEKEEKRGGPGKKKKKFFGLFG